MLYDGKNVTLHFDVCWYDVGTSWSKLHLYSGFSVISETWAAAIGKCNLHFWRRGGIKAGVMLKPLTSIACYQVPGENAWISPSPFFSSFNTSQIFQVKINLVIFFVEGRVPRRTIIPHLFGSDYLKSSDQLLIVPITWICKFGKWYNVSKNWSFFASKTSRRLHPKMRVPV